MDRINKAKSLVAISLGLSLLSYCCYDHPYNPEYEIIARENGPFGRYSRGDIYIGDEEYISSIKNSVNERDVLIVMGYENDNDHLDPNASILSSYRITDKDERNEILNVLKLYGQINDTRWNRSIDSMRVEWTVHNFFYELNYERDRTQNVDLDNSEEKLYNNYVLKRLIK